MTPLARRIARELLNRHGETGAAAKSEALAALSGAHFFDVTEAMPIVEEIMNAMDKAEECDTPFTPCTFLPAPNTWLEWQSGGGTLALSLCEGKDGRANATSFHLVPDAVSVVPIGGLDLKTGQPFLRQDEFDLLPGKAAEKRRSLKYGYAFLAIVNSPNIVGHRAHPARKTLARKLAKTFGTGIGPLLPWHEIKLEINKPEDIDDGAPHEATLTGRRALHFVRKFIRIRRGKLEYVRAHWRGDPAIGIRRGHYVVTA